VAGCLFQVPGTPAKRTKPTRRDVQVPALLHDSCPARVVTTVSACERLWSAWSCTEWQYCIRTPLQRRASSCQRGPVPRGRSVWRRRKNRMICARVPHTAYHWAHAHVNSMHRVCAPYRTPVLLGSISDVLGMLSTLSSLRPG